MMVVVMMVVVMVMVMMMMVSKAYVVVVLLLAFEALVKYHQLQCRPLHTGGPLPTGVIFPNVTREDADSGLINCLKFFANYGFYRVGREVCAAFIDLVAVTALSGMLNRLKCSSGCTLSGMQAVLNRFNVADMFYVRLAGLADSPQQLIQLSFVLWFPKVIRSRKYTTPEIFYGSLGWCYHLLSLRWTVG